MEALVTPHFATPDLFMPMSHKKDARLIWVNIQLRLLNIFLKIKKNMLNMVIKMFGYGAFWWVGRVR